ncbi:Hypothetical predicted protein [Mytilus galloprovincialis]|uniref:Fibronectin type-III domain-containing protein n=1 Tax=Mytilus galloprovincialis TaxID=29158 RepID=A0A8B6DTG7_MYTGA|nr:Hypothetical predicted protein [Mytilus galloprovincialis]
MSRDTCDQCKYNEKLNKAVLWCIQCEESLCDDCVKVHKNQKFLRNHNLVNINEAPKFSKPPNECHEHPNLELEFYCFDHKTLSCKECLICRHKLCEKVQTVDAAASNIQQTKPFTGLNDRIKIIQSTLQTMMTDRTKNIEDIESEIKEIKEKTRETKESFIKHLEFLEKQLFSDLDKAKDIHIQKINEVIRNTKSNIDSIEEKSTAFEWTKKNGSDNQIFMLIHTSQKDISDIEDRVEELTSNVVSINITPSSDKISTAQLSIGSFEVKKTLQNNAFKSKRLHQCQSLAPCNIQQDLLENVSYTTMCTSNSIDIQWYTYSTDDSIITYLVEYKNEETKLEGIPTEQPRVKLLHLEPNTKYQIKIGADRKNGESFTLLQTIISTTYPKVIEEMLKCTNISGDSQREAEKKEDTDPKTYCLKVTKEGHIIDSKKVKKSTMHSENVRKCTMISDISKTAESLQNQKTIIVMGASGSGKTTFIDAMFNLMIGVSHDSDHRFKIVNMTESEKKKLNKQYESQTEGVTWYTFPMLGETQMNGIINIIDTPGFDDTRGKDYDEEIPRMIEILFSKGEGIESLDAICLVEKLSANRLTERQENIFKSVTKIFGKDIADNIFPCLTFDDGGEAHILKAFEKAGMSYLDKVHFRFNNSKIFSGYQDFEVWRKRRQSFGKFFKEINNVLKKSLLSTKDVLNSRSSLQLQLLSLQQNLRNQVQNISNVEKRRSIIQDCQMDIDENKDFIQISYAMRKTKRANKLICLNCPKCEKTCHNNFRIWSKYMCEVMYWNGCCKICDCSYSDHISEKFKYHEVFERVEITLNDIFKKYKTALDKKLNETDNLGIEENSLRNSFKNLAELFYKIQNLINQLNKIALTPATFSLEHYIADVIRLEIYSNEPGSEKRIALLQNISEVVKKTDEKNSVFNNLCEAFEITPSSPHK